MCTCTFLGVQCGVTIALLQPCACVCVCACVATCVCVCVCGSCGDWIAGVRQVLATHPSSQPAGSPTPGACMVSYRCVCFSSNDNTIIGTLLNRWSQLYPCIVVVTLCIYKIACGMISDNASVSLSLSLSLSLLSLSPSQWSFGVVLWEIMTLGKLPYEEVQAEELLGMLTTGHRLQQPKNCPDDL